ncbi:sensor histidine kinase [Paenibacillus flagellatus]|uniref:histidine kinase n=1 Tax=Paenibacillus flagellatus TaxID=2211139 RepID=A0A2V5K812_9BACL|nr:sensor histidine kinase [Paenibacillus flagellatus]PYI55601.1 sensor histidine kinase [Paenibacillus flagellatus]
MRWRSVLDAYRHMRIRNKLSLLIAFIIALSMAFTIIVQQYAFSIYDGQIYDKSARALNMSSAAIEKELDRLEQLSYSIATDVTIQGWLTSLKESASDYDRLIVRQHLVDRLFSYSGSEPYLHSIQLIDARGTEHDGGNIVRIDPGKMRRILDTAASAMGDNRWIYPDADDSAMIAVREIRSYSNTNFDLAHLGTLVVRINIDRIVKDLASEEGDIVLTSGEDVIFPQRPAVDAASLTSSVGPDKGYSIRDIGGEPYFVSHIRSRDTGWTYWSVTPFDRIFESILFIKRLVVIVFVGIFALVIVLGIRFSRSITRPIDDLIVRMKLAQKGNFEEANVLAPSDVRLGMDEIGLLHRTFRFMIERINLLIKENYANRLLIKETEFKALQAQINPHFLYNTLESINWMAKINRQPEISEMTEALGYLLRNSVDMKKPMITVGEELDIVRSYVTIQQYRFEERLRFELDVPAPLLDRPLPKLTLQPLLENAIHYALEPTIEPCRIAVRGFEEGDGFFLTVEDDGPGMPPDTLERLRSGELRTKGKGIGLLNIDERIKIAFGDEYGIRIGGGPGRGTRITIALPRETGG